MPMFNGVERLQVCLGVDFQWRYLLMTICLLGGGVLGKTTGPIRALMNRG